MPIDACELPLEQAESLAQHKGDLSLNAYTSLSDEAAAFLARHREGSLWLDGLTSISAEAAAALRPKAGMRLPRHLAKALAG